MIPWLYKWLPIVFGCHCRPDRSFYWKGKKFPLCARCTGELAGIFAGIFIYAFHPIPLYACFLLMIPLVIDGFLQRLTTYESKNWKRLATGLLFGVGLYSFFACTTVMAFYFGGSLVR